MNKYNRRKKTYKVVVLTSAHPVFDARIFHKQSKSLANIGYDVTLIAQHSLSETVDGVKIVDLRKPKNRFDRMFLLTSKIFLTALKQKAHVYHFHDPELIPVGLLLKLLTSAKVIYDVHEDYSKAILTKHWIPQLLRKSISKAICIIERFSAIFLDYIITVENISTPFPKYKTDWVNNYPILDLSKGKKLSEFKKNNYNIIYTGNITRTRGIVETVKSLGYIDETFNVRLVLIGKFTDTSEEFVRSLKEFSKVDFIGWISHELVYDYLSKADIGIAMLHPVPNYISAKAVKLFEYMSVGLPIVASDFPLWKNILADCGITVDPTNPERIGKAIQYLLERPELREEMSNNGYKMAHEKYNWNEESKKLFRIYNKILFNN